VDTERRTRLVVRWPLAIGLAFATLWIGPYRWPMANHSQEVLPILARLHPGLFARDFAVQSFLGPSPRVAYELLISGLVRAGFTFAHAYFAVQLATLIAVCGAVVAIVAWIADERELSWPALAVSAALVLWLCAANHHLWNLPIVDSTNAVPGTFAMSFALWGWYAGLRGRWRGAYVLLGFAALLQVLVGIMGALLLAPLAIRDIRNNRTMLVGLAIGLLACAACVGAVVVPMILTPSHVAGAELIRIFGYVRAPHHWLPSSAGSLHWINQAALAFATVGLGRALWESGATHRLKAAASSAVVIAAALLVLNDIGVEHWRIAAIAKLQAQRAMPFAHLAILLLAAALMLQMMRDRRYATAVLLLVAPICRADGVALLAIGAAEWALRSNRSAWTTALQLTCAAVVCVSIPMPARLPVPPVLLLGVALAGMVALTVAASRLHIRANPLFVVPPAAALTVLLTLSIAIANDAPAAPGRWHIARAVSPSIDGSDALTPEMRRLGAALEAASSPGALVLFPPLASFDFLPMASGRSAVFDWKNVPYADDAIAEWGARLDAILGRRLTAAPTEDQLRAWWAGRTPDELLAVARRYGAEYLVTRDSWHQTVPAERLSTTDGWTIWKLEGSSLPHATVAPAAPLGARRGARSIGNTPLRAGASPARPIVE